MPVVESLSVLQRERGRQQGSINCFKLFISKLGFFWHFYVLGLTQVVVYKGRLSIVDICEIIIKCTV